MSPVPPEVIVMAMLSAAFFVGYLALMRYTARLEHQDRLEQAAAAEARRLAERAAFERHVEQAFEVADPVDWRRHEAEWRS